MGSDQKSNWLSIQYRLKAAVGLLQDFCYYCNLTMQNLNGKKSHIRLLYDTEPPTTIYLALFTMFTVELEWEKVHKQC